MNDPTGVWFAVYAAVTLYCIVQGGRDIREKRYAWAAAAGLAAIALLMMPIQGQITVRVPIHQ